VGRGTKEGRAANSTFNDKRRVGDQPISACGHGDHPEVCENHRRRKGYEVTDTHRAVSWFLGLFLFLLLFLLFFLFFFKLTTMASAIG